MDADELFGALADALASPVIGSVDVLVAKIAILGDHRLGHVR